MIASITAATLLGVEGRPVQVEVHVSGGLPGFTVVGLPDEACREARDRVRAALLSSGLEWPQKRITVNLAPAALRKGGAALDLPMAVGVLVAAGVVPPVSTSTLSFLGELGLDGAVRRVTGVVPLVDALPSGTVVVPYDCVEEARVVGRHEVRGVVRLEQVVNALRGRSGWPPNPPPPSPRVPEPFPDLADVRGQGFARQALEVSAAGFHHILLTGPPGAGKTMLARRLPGLLPPLERDQAFDVMRVHSAAGLPLPPGSVSFLAPFRAPHHSTSMVALVGGGTALLRPGELTLANHGVLFLDELGEFPAHVLDALRQPLEEGVVRVARARGSMTFPARFLLVAATNPCPCGWARPARWSVPAGRARARPTEDDTSNEDEIGARCRCSPPARTRYARRLSGPLLDRFDLRLEVGRPEVNELLAAPPGEATAPCVARVAQARLLAHERGVAVNASLSREDLDRFAALSPSGRRLVEHHLRAGSLTARGLQRVRRVARTLADLAGKCSTAIADEHLCMALELRRPASFELVAP